MSQMPPAPQTPSPESAAAKDPAPAKLSIAFSGQFPELLHYLNSTLAITTYRTGELVLLRPGADRGTAGLDMRGVAFDTPSGIAWEAGRLAVATTSTVWEFRDVPAAAELASAEDDERYDACYLPCRANVTGNLQIHEMCWARGQSGAPSAYAADPARPVSEQPKSPSQLWFVATQFSCLATRSDTHSFTPRWRPPFISELKGDDRCHLNGMGLRDGLPRYVSCLAQTNTRSGWRENKQSSGIVMDVASNQIIAAGLSMPHSPRWHNGKLWILESGNGGIGTIDLAGGRYHEVARVPGFTRGLDMVGPYAFIGLSLVRPTNAFTNTALARIPRHQLECGVWALDTRSGMFVGAMRFAQGVDEIFGVQTLVGLRMPEVSNDDPALLSAAIDVPPEG